MTDFQSKEIYAMFLKNQTLAALYPSASTKEIEAGHFINKTNIKTALYTPLTLIATKGHTYRVVQKKVYDVT